VNSKKKILAEAAKLIHAKGFNNTSLQDILKATAVSKSNFYYHFDSKEQLGFDVLEGRVRFFYRFVIEQSLDNRDLSPKERINAFLDRTLALGSAPEGELGCPFGNLAQEMSSINEALRQSLSMFFKAGAERLEACFEEGKTAGEFKETLPSKQLAEFVLAQVQGSFLLRKTHKNFRIMESNIELLRQVVRNWET